MARILKLIDVTREESPTAFIVLPLTAFVFAATTFGYIALTIANH